MNLSDYFTLEEMTFSQLAVRKGLRNEPPDDAFEALRLLCMRVLDPLRRHLGRPLQISSGYRSGPVNAALGGTPNSQHVRGQAADLVCPGVDTDDLFKAVIRAGVPFDQMIYEGSWVHVSHDAGRPRQRGQILKATFVDGRARYAELDTAAALALR